MDKSGTTKASVFKAKTCSKTCQRQEILQYQVHLIPTWRVEIKVSSHLHTWSIHLHYTQTLFYETCTHWETSKGPIIITENLWRLKLINMSWSHGNLLYLYHSSYNQGCFTCFPTCWRSLIGRTFPWMILRPDLQVIRLVQRDGMNGLITCLWHHLGCGPTKIK